MWHAEYYAWASFWNNDNVLGLQIQIVWYVQPYVMFLALCYIYHIVVFTWKIICWLTPIICTVLYKFKEQCHIVYAEHIRQEHQSKLRCIIHTYALNHYNDIIKGVMASQITSRLIRHRSKKISKLRITGLCIIYYVKFFLRLSYL